MLVVMKVLRKNTKAMRSKIIEKINEAKANGREVNEVHLSGRAFRQLAIELDAEAKGKPDVAKFAHIDGVPIVRCSLQVVNIIIR